MGTEIASCIDNKTRTDAYIAFKRMTFSVAIMSHLKFTFSHQSITMLLGQYQVS